MPLSVAQRVNEWKTPGKKTIMRCAVNQRQVVIALSGGELVYFEMDPTGQLNEYTERKEMPAEVRYAIERGKWDCWTVVHVIMHDPIVKFASVINVDHLGKLIMFTMSTEIIYMKSY